jgi:RimJ/RimL family protein N-acetyltransferase
VLEVDPAVVAELFAPERPGPMLPAHVAASGVGSCRADRATTPRTGLAELPGGNVALRGEPVVLPGLTGLVEAPEHWLPALRAVDPHTGVWDRLVAVLPADADLPAAQAGVRPLTPDDVPALDALDPSIAWIGETWGGSAGLARSGRAYAAVGDGRVLSVACSFYVGVGYEDIGVVTEPAARGRGLSTACAAALAADVRRRGKQPSWTTSPGNLASRAVAARLGFVHQRDDVLYAVGTPVPADG